MTMYCRLEKTAKNRDVTVVDLEEEGAMPVRGWESCAKRVPAMAMSGPELDPEEASRTGRGLGWCAAAMAANGSDRWGIRWRWLQWT
jgi:hypothetical protein